MYIDPYFPKDYCTEAYAHPSPIDALTLPPWAINATVAVIPRSIGSAEKVFFGCCLWSDLAILDECWSVCQILAPTAGNSRAISVGGPPRPDDLSVSGMSSRLSPRDQPGGAVKVFENCMVKKGFDIHGMNPKAEYRVVGTDGKTKPLEGAASLGRGLNTAGLGVVVLACLGLLV